MLDYHRFKTICDLFMRGKTEEARLALKELQRRYVALCDENTTLGMQIREYEDALCLARNLVREHGFYWLITGGIRQGPFCPACYGRDGLLMRLSGGPGDRYCVVCREQFGEEPEQCVWVVAAAQDFEEAAPIPATTAPPRKATVIPFDAAFRHAKQLAGKYSAHEA